MAALQIRRAGPEDLGAIVRIERACFAAPWSEALVLAGLQKATDRFYIAALGKDPAGYMGVSQVLDECYGYNLAVLPEFRRRGIARCLLAFVCEDAFRSGAAFLSLEVRRSNGAAIALYRQLGFRQMGERKNFYSSPREDALILTRFRDGGEGTVCENSCD